MKKVLLILSVTLFLTGCSSFQENTSKSDSEMTQNITVNALQQTLEYQRLSQLLQAKTYEKEIERLEEEKQSVIESVNSQKEEEKIPVRYQVKKTEGGVEIVSYLGDEKSISVPATIEGEQVVSIGEGAFRNASLESISLPQGVKKIGWFAFYGCYRLQSVELPESIEEIEYGAFELCNAGLSFTCVPTSYAAMYAQSYGFLVEEMNVSQ